MPAARLLGQGRIPIDVTSGHGAPADLDGISGMIVEKPFDADQLANALVELTTSAPD